MKLRKIEVRNLYSYADASCEFKDYNIVAGPNGSGKTNLARILNIFYNTCKQLPSGDYRWLSLNSVLIYENMIYKERKDNKAYLILGIELDNYEVKLFKRILIGSILQEYLSSTQKSISHDYTLINNIDIKYMKYIEVALYWYIDPMEFRSGIRPAQILIRLKNGLTLINEGQFYFTYTHNLKDYINENQNFVSYVDINSKVSVETLEEVAKNVRGLLTKDPNKFIRWYLCLTNNGIGDLVNVIDGKQFNILDTIKEGNIDALFIKK